MKVWVPGALIAAALVVAAWAAAQQAAVQAQMNVEMGRVLQDLREARRLTALTAEALDPLKPTAEAIDAMNRGLRGMVADVKAINASLERITSSQRSILMGVSRVGEQTAGVVRMLGALEDLNRGLHTTTSSLSVQAGGQAEKLGQLSRLTDSAIPQLQELNRRFQFMKRLH